MTFQRKRPQFSPEERDRVQEASRKEEQIIWRGLASKLTQCYDKRTKDRISIVGKMARGGRYRVVDSEWREYSLKYQDCVLTETKYGIFNLIGNLDIVDSNAYTFEDFVLGNTQAWRRDGHEVKVKRNESSITRKTLPMYYMNPITNNSTFVMGIGRMFPYGDHDTPNDLFKKNPK